MLGSEPQIPPIGRLEGAAAWPGLGLQETLGVATGLGLPLGKGLRLAVGLASGLRLALRLSLALTAWRSVRMVGMFVFVKRYKDCGTVCLLGV